ncbi:hypothetical protein [Kurthia sibirica]|uniref:hypothetical protein n=1 Tax=Kurthia sibirica TaxID=202750 RepID=UPI0011735D5C|nr:hypothetical protein KSI01_22100 [Kurthia sibirica]
MNTWVLNLFLYFPEDKREYIPAVIELTIILALCVIVFFAIRRSAARQSIKAKELEKKILENNKQDIQGQ